MSLFVHKKDLQDLDLVCNTLMLMLSPPVNGISTFLRRSSFSANFPSYTFGRNGRAKERELVKVSIDGL
jgi:hypothetical protein